MTKAGARGPILAALAVALAAAVYVPGLPGEFVYDDHRLIVENDGFKRPFDLSRAFLRDYYASDMDRMGLGYYRPVAILSEEFDYRRGGGRPLAFHLTNIALHAAATLLVFALARRLVPRTYVAAFAAAASFAVHAAHAESVAFISGRVDPLATVFGLGALWLHLSGRRVWAGACWLLALCGKEMAVTIPAVAALLEIGLEGWPSRSAIGARLARYLPYLAAVAVYLPLRATALGHLLAPSGDGGWGSFAKPLVVIGSYLGWLVLPPSGVHLEPAPVAGALALAACLAACALPAGAWLLARRGLHLEAALAGSMLLTLLPVAQLKSLETALSERFLYLPSALAALLAGCLLARASARGRAAGMAAASLLAVLAAAHAAILVPRAVVWRDEVALWKAKESEDGGSLKARLNLAHAYAARGDREQALAWYVKVKEIAPHLGPGIDAEMSTLAGDIRSAGAEDALGRALAAHPEDGGLWNNRGFQLYARGDLAAATAAFERAIEITPARASAWLGLALTRLKGGAYDAAEEAATRASALDPDLGLARAVLAECALRAGRPCDALRIGGGLTLTEPGERAALEGVLAKAAAACPEGR